ncbi:alcohol dehydrogenase catalytic domain-containing protein [Agromyces atrinae]|uniref:zinc-binding dehydrogenase n=1 Tax=Agromyces atrinae TaxID=592376 RepID=UPI001F58D999|nr:alcohol dehydrogenase catalytic domain-containing protein [Agromyces atrinae]MCI2956948.1 alcohol dehydrogenase catalytic domain-containing protein [Agromyces atrinae]
MLAVVYDAFGETPELRSIATPTPSPRGVVVRVEATGLCRSDWHGWSGHDSDIRLPHVPGHELVGRVAAVGAEVERFAVGDRVTTPFVCACGRCDECRAGDGQVCRNQTQPGFTHAGSYAEFVALHDADVNLITVPDDLDAGAAALLGCRFATSYRGLVHRARVERGEYVVVFGCGGVGRSAVMIAAALGAHVVAVDIDAGARAAALAAGAVAAVDPRAETDLVARLRELTDGGAHVTVEALGLASTTDAALRTLRRRGRHVQIGLFPADPVVPLGVVIAGELDVFGSHGMPAADYPELLDLVASGALRPESIIERRIPLAEAPAALVALPESPGVTLIEVSP